MASILSLFLLSIICFLSISAAASSAASSHPSNQKIRPPSHRVKPKPRSKPTPPLSTIPPEIVQACKATRFPDVCQSSLSGPSRVRQSPTPLQVIQSALSVSSDNLKVAQSMVKSILDSSTGSINRTNAAKNCIELLGDSMYRISSTDTVLPRGRTKEARAWMSAALLYQYDCWNAFKYANDTSQTSQVMSFLSSLSTLTSNALSMIVSYDIYGEKIASWGPPKTERDGFWEPPRSGSSTFRGGFPSNLKADVTVCKDGRSNGCYKTVQDAVNAAPDNQWGRKFVIRVKQGVYEEIVRVPLEKKNVVFLGDGMGKTVITGSLNAGQPGVSTFNTATVGVLGDGFMASGLTIRNTAGAPTHQATALRLDSDLSVIENCEFLGNQDTLYAHSLRQYYKSCRIQGNVDFIFGNSAAIFEDCTILVTPRQQNPEKGENNAVTAQGRTDPAQSTGFVFQNCLINGTEEYMALYHAKPSVHKNFLGRPWKEYSRVVFIHCTLESLITPKGWLPWGTSDFAQKTLYYGEFGNSGPGSSVSQRVTWSNQIPAEHVNTYSVQNFIQGDEWIPTSS
uniref:pectinesterase n=1 Tax=Rhizophora mucronata TaxID=61149 RepID=A0A2P2P1J2_RHIMU